HHDFVAKACRQLLADAVDHGGGGRAERVVDEALPGEQVVGAIALDQQWCNAHGRISYHEGSVSVPKAYYSSIEFTIGLKEYFQTVSILLPYAQHHPIARP